MKFSNDALLLMAHICNPRSYALPGRMYQWFLSQFYAAFTTTIESESSSIPLASDDQHHDVDSKISKAPNNHKDEAVKDSVLLDRANDDKNANDNDDNLVSFVLKEPDLGRLAVQKTVVDKTRPEEDNYSIDQDSNGSTDWFHCAFSVGAYFYVDASSEPCPYGYPQEEDCCSSIPYGWDNGVYYTTSREEEESAYASGIKEKVPYSIPQDTAWASDARGLQTAPPVCTGEIYNVKAMSLPEDFEQLVADCLDKSNSCPNKKLECWNVEKIKDMKYAFQYRGDVPPGVARWDMSHVESVKAMFKHADVSEVDFSYWKLKSVDSLDQMFYNARNVQGISDWDVSRVTSLRTTFSTIYKFHDPDLSQWDVSRVVDMSFAFDSVHNFPTSIWNWDVRNVKSVKHMFIHDKKAPSWWDISKLSLQLWELNEEADVDGMFGKGTLSEVANIDNHDQVRRLCPYINARWRDDPAFFNDWNKKSDSNGHDIGIDCYCPKGQKIKVTNPEFLLYKGCTFDHTNCPSKFGIQPGCWDMSEVTMHFEVFRNKLVPAAIWGWNVGKMIPKAFFKEAIFNDPLGIRNFEFQSGVDASSMFENADFGPYFASVDISKMKLTTAENMFLDATMGNKHLAEVFGIDDKFVGSNHDIDGWSDRDIRNLSSYIRFKRKGNPVCDAV